MSLEDVSIPSSRSREGTNWPVYLLAFLFFDLIFRSSFDRTSTTHARHAGRSRCRSGGVSHTHVLVSQLIHAGNTDFLNTINARASAKCQMPNVKCQMPKCPNAKCQMPNASRCQMPAGVQSVEFASATATAVPVQGQTQGYGTATAAPTATATATAYPATATANATATAYPPPNAGTPVATPVG